MYNSFEQWQCFWVPIMNTSISNKTCENWSNYTEQLTSIERRNSSEQAIKSNENVIDSNEEEHWYFHDNNFIRI